MRKISSPEHIERQHADQGQMHLTARGAEFAEFGACVAKILALRLRAYAMKNVFKESAYDQVTS